jgi:DNA-binding response OmpR family regulator
MRCAAEEIADITPVEFKLLATFIRNRGRVLTSATARPGVDRCHLWRPGGGSHVSNLRKKIEEKPAEPRYLASVRGMGYRFDG